MREGTEKRWGQSSHDAGHRAFVVPAPQLNLVEQCTAGPHERGKTGTKMQEEINVAAAANCSNKCTVESRETASSITAIELVRKSVHWLGHAPSQQSLFDLKYSWTRSRWKRRIE